MGRLVISTPTIRLYADGLLERLSQVGRRFIPIGWEPDLSTAVAAELAAIREQLAAQAAKVAAGQALADAERALNALYDEVVTDSAEWQGRHGDALEAAQNATGDLLAAFPPAEKGGAR